MNHDSIYSHGFIRVGACSPHVHLGDVARNTEEIITQLRSLDQAGVAVAVFPELALTGTGLGELYRTDVLLSQTETGLAKILEASKDLLPVFALGLPVRVGRQVYNSAVVVHRGEILGVIFKKNLANADFGRFQRASQNEIWQIRLCGGQIWVDDEPSFSAADVAGLAVQFTFFDDLATTDLDASMIGVLSACPALVGSADQQLCQATSLLRHAALVYAAPGAGSSSTDFSWDAARWIIEDGKTLRENEPFSDGPVISDVDLAGINAKANRIPSGIYGEDFVLDPPKTNIGFLRDVARYPFIRADRLGLLADCRRTFDIQVAALTQRLEAIGWPKIVLGVSGGLDSTLALLVATRVFDLAGRSRKNILTFTMPGFATSEHTKNNAQRLAEALGCSFEVLDIRPSAEQMLNTISHPLDQYDVTFENVQAGLRTDYLFRIANQRGGIVLGTGDLSEISLGWCTYGVGDQMSHYNVNAGIPKTMMQYLIASIIEQQSFSETVSEILDSILNTEITPELIPTTADSAPQATQSTIGPYNLHDFTIFHLLNYGFGPAKIAFLAEHAWGDIDRGIWPESVVNNHRVSYSRREIVDWLRVFGRRFYTQQFKRTASVDGPAVLSAGSLSPRVGWQMPSDMSDAAWQRELDEIPLEALDE